MGPHPCSERAHRDGATGSMPTLLSRRSALAAVPLALVGCAASSTDVPDPSTPASTTSEASPQPTSASTPEGAPTPSPTRTPQPSLEGDPHNTWAFAPLADPDAVVVEGTAATQRAWSTSKVLVLAAFLQHRGVTELSQLEEGESTAFRRALSESDMESLLALRRQIPERGASMTQILRSIGDTETVAPATREGTMTWTVREQVRFMAALHAGRVVSPDVSALLVTHLVPVESQRWGLGRVGASAYKGGWLRPDTETRQMGIVNGYAVALLTLGVGPTVRQIDGDDAHVEQLDTLAGMLAQRLSAR